MLAVGGGTVDATVLLLTIKQMLRRSDLYLQPRLARKVADHKSAASGWGR